MSWANVETRLLSDGQWPGRSMVAFKVAGDGRLSKSDSRERKKKRGHRREKRMRKNEKERKEKEGHMGERKEKKIGKINGK